mgnify:CR=1 FL=1
MLNRRQFISSAAAISFSLTTPTGSASTSTSSQIFSTYSVHGDGSIIRSFGCPRSRMNLAKNHVC